MEEPDKDEIVYSEPVRDIMGAVPGRILRWGTGIIMAVMALFIFFLWLVKYPDRIPAPVEITTVNPPAILVSKISGRIDNLYVNDRDEVGEGQLLAVMETAASISEINHLRSIVDTVSGPGRLLQNSLPVFTELGELQSYWSSFLKSLSDYSNYNINDFYGNKILSLTDEINAILSYIGKVRVKEDLYSENQMLETRKYRRDSLLYSEGVYSESELEKSR